MVAGEGGKVRAMSAIAVEAIAIKEGLKLARGIQAEKVIIESDSEIRFDKPSKTDKDIF